MQTFIRASAISIICVTAGIAAAQETISATRQASPSNQVIDSVGGIVTFKSTLGTRVVLQDPNSGSYAAIQIRDRKSAQGDTGGYLWSRVEVGDWVSFTNVLVTTWTGNTILHFNDPERFDPTLPASTYTIVSSGNALPSPVPVSLEQILAPTANGGNYTIDPSALSSYQSLEGMRVVVNNVQVTELDAGRFFDNYVIRSQDDASGSGPSAYAADYNNYNRGENNIYHPFVEVGAEFNQIVGYMERSRSSSGASDYYQLVTTTSASFGLPSSGDFDGDGDVDGRDFLTWQRDPGVGDLADWQENYGFGTVAATTVVPEPNCLTLLIGLAFLGRSRQISRLYVN
jgi:hypothetical protein